jgi:hypothetical protein
MTPKNSGKPKTSGAGWDTATKLPLREVASCLLAAIVVLVSGCRRESPPSAPHRQTDDEAQAIEVAKVWVKANGRDLDSASYDASQEPDGSGWHILIMFAPAMPGDHVSLLLDSRFKIKEVIGGE